MAIATWAAAARASGQESAGATDSPPAAFTAASVSQSWMPSPKKMIDPRPKVTLAAKTADLFVMPDGLMYVTDWNAGLNVLQYEG